MRKKVTIIGAGESGIGASLLSQHQGYDTFVSSRNKVEEKYKLDLINKGIAFEEGGHTIDSILASSLIVKSPGIPSDIDILQRACAKRIEVIDEIEFAFRHIKGKIIAVSGTNGKTTVAHLMHHLATFGGLNATLAGNVGISLSRKVFESDKDWYIVEISSFQLESIKTFRPNIALLLNITRDHLSRYDYEFQRYSDTKFRLIQNVTPEDSFIYYEDDPQIKNGVLHKKILAKKLNITLTGRAKSAAFFDGSSMCFSVEGNTFNIPYEQVPLGGRHNCINVMAAVLAIYLAGMSPIAIKEGLATFSLLPHRLEQIATIRGVKFINDSKATNVDAVLKALESYDAPLIWIAGGIDKGNRYDPICRQVHDKVKTLLCLGVDNKKLKTYFSTLKTHIEEVADMNMAVNRAWKHAQKGDTVLLSPACSSFDLFESYEDRGEQFRNAVKTLEESMQNTS